MTVPNKIKLSVIIPSYCTASRHDWSRLYLSLVGYSYQSLSRSLFEVIVIDDGSDWDLSDLIKEWAFDYNIRVIKQIHTGMCSAYQVGIQQALGEYILLGIDDNIPAYTLLEEHLNHLDQSKNSLIWGREYHMQFMKKIFNPMTGQLNDGANIDKPPFLIDKTDVLNNYKTLQMNSVITDKYLDIEKNLESTRYKEFTKANWLVMRVGNQSLPKNLLKEIGGIDTAFDPSGWYMDLELGLRLLKHNKLIQLNKNAIMIHLSHHREEVARHDETSKHDYFYKKHPLLEVLCLPLFFKGQLSIADYHHTIERFEKISRGTINESQSV